MQDTLIFDHNEETAVLLILQPLNQMKTERQQAEQSSQAARQPGSAPLPPWNFQLLLGYPKILWGQLGICNPSSMFWFCFFFLDQSTSTGWHQVSLYILTSCLNHFSQLMKKNSYLLFLEGGGETGEFTISCYSGLRHRYLIKNVFSHHPKRVTITSAQNHQR